jgi:hypothetical protein
MGEGEGSGKDDAVSRSDPRKTRGRRHHTCALHLPRRALNWSQARTPAETIYAPSLNPPYPSHSPMQSTIFVYDLANYVGPALQSRDGQGEGRGEDDAVSSGPHWQLTICAVPGKNGTESRCVESSGLRPNRTSGLVSFLHHLCTSCGICLPLGRSLPPLGKPLVSAWAKVRRAIVRKAGTVPISCERHG